MARKTKINKLRAKGSTDAGTHVPIMVKQVISALAPEPGLMVVDCTLGYGGHARAFMKALGPEGTLLGLDMDGKELAKTKRRFAKAKSQFSGHNLNFSQIDQALINVQADACDIIFADIGVSSMQVDDPMRGISYKADGPLDMRMDHRLEKTGADLLAELSQQEFSEAIWELSDEPDHEIIASYIAGQRISRPISTTGQLLRIVLNAKGMTEKTFKQKQKKSAFGSLHPAARTFQALRILVNDELGSLKTLLQKAPDCLKPGGRIGIISFHSGEDRLVNNSFEKGFNAGIYSDYSRKAIVPNTAEVVKNPRSASAKFRWAKRS